MAEHIGEPDRQKSAPGPEQTTSQTTTTTTTTTATARAYASGHCQPGLLTVADVPEVWRAYSVDSTEASLRLFAPAHLL